MLTIVGGTYLEICTEPYWYELYGSGLRGAIAISQYVKDIKLISCIGEDRLNSAELICSTFNIEPSFSIIKETIIFKYYHPLSKPTISPNDLEEIINLPSISEECILIYGQLESRISVNASYAVYDPQNRESFKKTDSKVEHLAIVLNKQEALYFSTLDEKSSITDVGKNILSIEEAEVVVIKNGSEGAIVIDSTGYHHIPVFNTNNVFPIGSGDIFSAVFAAEWAVKRNNPVDAAMIASRSTAEYCNSRLLPLTEITSSFFPISIKNATKKRKIYLAAPFFSISDRWLNNEIIRLLIEFNNEVFSPLHDIGFGESSEVARKDLEAIKNSDLIFAVLIGLDPGTIFEIGYARALDKKVIILAEKMNQIDLTMFTGTNCEIIEDLSTAIYKASWANLIK